MLGTIVNSLAIVVGGVVGWTVGRWFPVKMREMILAGLGLVVFVAGVEMALSWSGTILIVIVSVVLGTAIGELLGIERGLQALGAWLQRQVGARVKGNFAQGFIYASLVYCVGPMAILGAMESGIQGNHSILFAKASIDGITAIAFAATLGPGVVLAAVPVLLYQGGLTLGALGLADIVAVASAQITATGGILIMALGLKMLSIKDISVANMLPALPLAALLAMLFEKVLM